ncbi:MAG: arginase family protein [Bacteroidales bacterium]|jgi:arginase family enzyme|nr:arginase family protein [Bacteroidales bacterium]
MNFNDYFDPIDEISPVNSSVRADKQLGSLIVQHTKDQPVLTVDKFHLAIVGVLLDAKDDAESLAAIRKQLYGLAAPGQKIKIYDLGNLKKGWTDEDHEAALRDIAFELITRNIVPVFLGATERVVYPVYHAYQKINHKINLVSIDHKIDITEDREKRKKSALWKILVEENEAIFTFSNIGFQSHFVGENTLQYLEDSLHNAFRLGYVHENIQMTEPVLRDADFVSLNVSSIRQSDAPGQTVPSPNGFYAEEICQLSRYTGLGNRLSAFGVFDYCLEKDSNSQTAQLIAQIIWYFIKGYSSRIVEYPLTNDKEFKKIIVNLDHFKSELVFYKSERTERWWIEVPSFKHEKVKNVVMSCTPRDYQMATQGEVPESWLKAFQKIN